MNDLIDRLELQRSLCHDCPYRCHEYCRAVKHIINAPKFDAAPKGFCKDCKHYCKDYGNCSEICKLVGDDDYCSFWERKDGKTNG